MRLLLAVLALVVVPAFGAVSGEWRVTQQRGSSTSSFVGETPDEAVKRCQDAIPTTASTRTEYVCQAAVYVATVTPDPPPPVCTDPKPADETRPGTCPTGTVGTWTQTRTYVEVAHPACWAPSAWLPADPPADVCKAPTPEPSDVLFTDDFRTGDFTKSTGGFKWLGGNSTQIVSDPGSPSGKALRFRFAGVSSGQDSFAERRFVLPNLKDVWVQVTMLVPANYVHRNDISSDNNKFVRFWYGPKTDGNDGYSNFVIKGGFSTLPADVLIAEWGRQGEGVGMRDSTATAGWITSADRGKEVTFTVHVRTDTKCSPGSKPLVSGGNGAFEAWKGTKKLLSYTQVCWRSRDGKNEFFDRGYLFGWANSGFSQQTDILVRRVSVATKNVYGVQ